MGIERRPALVLTGYRTPHEDDLRRRVTELGLEADVRILDWVSAEELEGLYRSAVCFVFPAVSSEGAAFWIIRTSPVSLRDFLWSKFWTGLVPVLALTEVLTIVGNQFLGVGPFVKVMAAVAIVFLSFALVGLAIGLGARYPRFNADPTQVAGSYGGVAFMIQAVLLVIVTIGLLGWPASIYLFQRVRRLPLTTAQQLLMAGCFASVVATSAATWLLSMRSGVRALQQMGG